VIVARATYEYSCLTLTDGTQIATVHVVAPGAERALSDPLVEEFARNTLVESSISEITKVPDVIIYVFAAIGVLSILHLGAKYGSKAFSQGDYVELEV